MTKLARCQLSYTPSGCRYAVFDLRRAGSYVAPRATRSPLATVLQLFAAPWGDPIGVVYQITDVDLGGTLLGNTPAAPWIRVTLGLRGWLERWYDTCAYPIKDYKTDWRLPAEYHCLNGWISTLTK